jgi:3-dehydroquinate dehydratase/shikimate dehydrogenase
VGLVASLADAEAASEAALRSLPAGVEVLELRADLVGEISAARLRSGFNGRLLYTLRSRAEGGQSEVDATRRQRLIAAAREFDWVDLELERDVDGATLAAVAPHQRVLSWHGASPGGVAPLVARISAGRATPAAMHKFVVLSEEADAPLDAVRALAAALAAPVAGPTGASGDLVVFCAGETGAWSRLVAAVLGAPWIYLAAGKPAAPGQPELCQWVRDYGLPDLVRPAALFGVLGASVGSSLSPRLHNAAYRALGLPYLYLPFSAKSFGDFWLQVVDSDELDAMGLPLRGLSVTAPFKELALAVAGAASPLADWVGSANTLIWNQHVWEAETTDAEGVVESLRVAGVELAGVPAAVLGAGGAGRAAAAGLAMAGCRVTLFNRGEDRGAEVARALHVGFAPWNELVADRFAILVNATPLGLEGAESLPLDVAQLGAGAAVVDMAYGEAPTALIEGAARRGCRTVDGREVLLQQARGQFFRMTGQELPEKVARQALGLAGKAPA